MMLSEARNDAGSLTSISIPDSSNLRLPTYDQHVRLGGFGGGEGPKGDVIGEDYANVKSFDVTVAGGVEFKSNYKLFATPYNRIRVFKKLATMTTTPPAATEISPQVQAYDFRKIRDAGTDDFGESTTSFNASEYLYEDKDRWTHYSPQFLKAGDMGFGNKYTGPMKDLIKMEFLQNLRKDSSKATRYAGQFYAYITDLSDQSSPNFDSGQDLGTIDPRYQFTSYERTVNLSFIVPSFNPQHYDEQWTKLKRLYEFSRQATTVYINIGEIHRDLAAIITDLSYNWDVEFPWDLDDTRGKPIYTEVSVTFKILAATAQLDLFNVHAVDESSSPANNWKNGATIT
jgi:murein L,D-transpeptidase YcbB/YkuD